MKAAGLFALAKTIVAGGKTIAVAEAILPLEDTIVPLIESGFTLAKFADAMPAAAAASKAEADAVCSLVQTAYALSVDPAQGSAFRAALKDL